MNECERLFRWCAPIAVHRPGRRHHPGASRNRYGLWVTQYANMNPTGYQASHWMLGAYGEAMRQYSGTGVVNTWSPIDLNIFRGEAWQWDLYANPTGSTTPATPAPSVQPSTPPANTGGISHTVCNGRSHLGPRRRV